MLLNGYPSVYLNSRYPPYCLLAIQMFYIIELTYRRSRRSQRQWLSNVILQNKKEHTTILQFILDVFQNKCKFPTTNSKPLSFPADYPLKKEFE